MHTEPLKEFSQSITEIRRDNEEIRHDINKQFTQQANKLYRSLDELKHETQEGFRALRLEMSRISNRTIVILGTYMIVVGTVMSCIDICFS